MPWALRGAKTAQSKKQGKEGIHQSSSPALTFSACKPFYWEGKGQDCFILRIGTNWYCLFLHISPLNERNAEYSMSNSRTLCISTFIYRVASEDSFSLQTERPKQNQNCINWGFHIREGPAIYAFKVFIQITVIWNWPRQLVMHQHKHSSPVRYYDLLGAW